MTHAVSPSSPLCSDPDYPALKDAVIEATGLAYYRDKDDDLADRLDRRLRAAGAGDCAAYLALLRDPRHGDAELDRLIEQLTVGETSFFRHPEIFDGLRSVIMPSLLERNRVRRRLRIWCAGCSVGAEAYTLSILLNREFARELNGWDVSIVGTDINRAFLARARDGVFNTWHLRGLDEDTLHECFTRSGDEWAIRPEFREGVSFQYHNLVRNPFPSLMNGLTGLDLIFCRNVLIYFSPDIMRRLVEQFRESLVDGGWLLVGHAEPNVNMFRTFHTVNVPGAVLYQRPETPAAHATGQAPRPAAGTDAVTPWPTFDPPVKNEGGHKAAGAAASASDDRAAAAGFKPSRRGRGYAASPRDDGGLAEVERLANAGDLDVAARCCERLAGDRPTDPVPHLRLAMLAEQLGRHRQAEASLRKALAIAPDNALAHYLTGLLEQKSGRRSGAVSAYARAIDALDSQPDGATLAGMDGLTAGELRELARMQQEVLGP